MCMGALWAAIYFYFAIAAVLATSNFLIFFEEEKATGRDFISFITEPHRKWGEADLQQGAKSEVH